MFGFEKLGKKNDANERERVLGDDDQFENKIDYTVTSPESENDALLSRRTFLRGGIAAAAVAAGIASPEEAEAAGKSFPIEFVGGLTLSEHNSQLLKLKLSKIVPNASSVQVSLNHSRISEGDFKDDITELRFSVLTTEGNSIEAHGVVFGNVSDQAAINRLLLKALEDLEEKKSGR